MARVSRLQGLISQGFDLSEHVPFTRTYKIKCSNCAALVINNTPCHESGCPNQKRDELQ